MGYNYSPIPLGQLVKLTWKIGKSGYDGCDYLSMGAFCNSFLIIPKIDIIPNSQDPRSDVGVVQTCRAYD